MRRFVITLVITAACSACVSAPALREASGVESTANPVDASSDHVGLQPMGRLNIAVRWPARGAFRTQLIPTSANLIRVQVQDADGDRLAATEIVRMGDESSIATASLSVPTGTGRKVLIQAFKDLVPAPGVPPVAEGSSTSVAVWPSTSTPLAISLVPAYGPLIFSMTPNGGPGSVLQVVGGNFQTGTLNVSLAGQSINDFVTLRGDLLEFTVPPDAQDGPVVIDVDGIQATGSFKVIRSLSLAAVTGVASGSTVQLQATARNAGGQLIGSPVLQWSVDRPDPESSMSEGAFTPLATGTFVVRATSGTLSATASVTTP